MSALMRQVMLDSPLVYWPFDESVDGSTCTDISGGGRHGTKVGAGATLGAASVVPGQAKAQLSSGSGGAGYWSRADEAAFQVGTGDFTYECWMVCTNGTGNYVQVFGRDAAASGNGQMLYLETGSGYGRFYCGPGAVIVGTSRLSDSNLHHVVVRRISGTGSIVVDGVQQNSAAAGNSVITSALRVNALDGGYPNFAGRMAHFAYYASGLSDARIKAHYQAGIRGGVAY